MVKEEIFHQRVAELKKQTAAVSLPPAVAERVDYYLERLARFSQESAIGGEFEILSSYLGWILSLPWEKETADNLDLKNAAQVLDRNHYDLEEVKERLLQFLAVRRLTLERKPAKEGSLVSRFSHAPVLCLVGLAGIGKTTLASSVAQALGRKFVRISLGALGSVLELRGASKALPEAEPGRIIKALVRAESKNPVILLDEIDKTAGEAALRADVMATLLEVLDPEQNSAFMDHYLDFPFDLSQILFICSANNLSSLSAALLDRLEVIRMPAYTDGQKLVIGRDYLLPKAMEATGLKSTELKISEEVWPKIIRPLGFDAGIRTLQRNIEGICGRVAKLLVEGKKESVLVTNENLKEYLPTW